MAKKRILIISLDGATFDVMRPFMEQGCLPNLRRIQELGIATELASVLPPVTAPAWTSFMTGKNPNKHGIFDFLSFDGSKYESRLNNSLHIKSKTIWQILSEKGRRVVVINLPYVYPPYPVNGIVIAGWDAPTNAVFTFPQHIVQQVFDVVPEYGEALDLSLWNYMPTESETDFDSFIAKIIKSSGHTVTLATHFLQKEDWDVGMVHFQETDWIQHKLWGYIQRACANAADRSKRVEQVRECYRVLDQHLGRLLEQTEQPRQLTIVLSDHGFGQNQGTICPNHELRTLGLLVLEERTGGQLKSVIKASNSTAVKTVYKAARNIRSLVQKRKALNKYKNWADMAVDTVPREKMRVDWSRTKAAFVGGSEAGFIYINLKGRGLSGCVEKAEYEILTERLVQHFMAMTHEKTGERLFKRVARGRELYAAPAPTVTLPDLILVPALGFTTGAGILERVVTEREEKGNHRDNGILLLAGHHVSRKPTNFQPNLVDLAPTILHLLDLPVPSDMDGRILEDAFTGLSTPILEEIHAPEVPDVMQCDLPESSIIEERLRGLGYVE